MFQFICSTFLSLKIRNQFLFSGMLFLVININVASAQQSIQSPALKPETKAQVMMLGVFHFRNPAKDVVKHDTFDVTTPQSQAYLESLAIRIQQFKPTKVLLEYNVDNQALVQQRYDDYLAGTYQLGVNEIYQIGFRVAKMASLKTVDSFDEQNVEWLAEPVFEYMKNKDPATQQRYDQLIENLQTQQNHDFATLSLKQLLIKNNQKAADDFNKSIYLMTNHIQEDGHFYGADAAASWWHRNFRMYARIQAQAQPGERVLVIGGQGHTAILKDLLALDTVREAVDINDYL